MTPEMNFAPDRFRTTLLHELEHTAPPRVSIGFPVQPTWDRARHGKLQLRTLLAEATDAMHQFDLAPPPPDTLLAPATALLDESSFWSHPADGVLLLLSPDGPEASVVRRLPFAPKPFSIVDHRYHVRQLWRHLEPDLPFYILALSAGGVVLYRASRHTIEPVELKDVPTTLDEALQYDEHVRSVRYHTKTAPGAEGNSFRRAAMYYGHEDAGDKAYVKEGLLRFFRTLDNGVRDVLAQAPTPPPLILAGTEALRGLYRKANQYRHLADTDIDAALRNGAEREWDVTALHERGWALVQPQADAARRGALERFHSAPERSAANVGSVLLAAATGRVDTLFVTDTQEAWGQYDPERYTVEVHPHREAEDTELMNAAVSHTLQAGGTVYVGPPEDLPEGAPIAALLRY
jgi:hypothetical protein